MSFEQELDEVLSELREMVLEKNWRKNGMTNFERYKYRKATKEHVCGLCQQTIPEGDVYLTVSGKAEGVVFSLKAHKDCWRKQQRRCEACIDAGRCDGKLYRVCWEMCDGTEPKCCECKPTTGGAEEDGPDA